MIYETASKCRVCTGEYFRSPAAPGGRCEFCTHCAHCSGWIPEKANRRFGGMCSASCSEAWEVATAPHRVAAAERQANALDRGSTSPDFRLAVFTRDDWTCHLCGYGIDQSATFPAPGSPVLDHVIPLAKGGANVADNMRAAHAQCNNRKKDVDLDIYLARDRVARGENPPAFLFANKQRPRLVGSTKIP